MKKVLIFCFALLLISPAIINAQLKFNSSGNLGIGTTNPLSELSLGSDGSSSYTVSIYSSSSTVYRGLNLQHYPNDDNYNYGLVSQIVHNSDGWKIAGIYTSSYPSSNTNGIYTYGIKAQAGRGEDGLNYGVMGKIIGDRDGAGIFGCDSDHAECIIPENYAGYFAGDVKITGDLSVTGSYPNSDIRYKKDVRIVEDDIFSKLDQLQTIRFKLKHPTEVLASADTSNQELITKELNSEKYTKDRIGLIAQELQLTFPEVVKEDKRGYLRVDYTQLIPILVQAIRQQQKQIEALESRNEVLKSATVDEGSITSSLESTQNSSDVAVLQQNIPNPFNENTIINYHIPTIHSYAMLNVYDLNGVQIKSYNITQTGPGEIMIPASELDPGLFIYNLIVDGIEVASRRMVLTE